MRLEVALVPGLRPRACWSRRCRLPHRGARLAPPEAAQRPQRPGILPAQTWRVRPVGEEAVEGAVEQGRLLQEVTDPSAQGVIPLERLVVYLIGS